MIPKSIKVNRFISPTIYKDIVDNSDTLEKTTESIDKHRLTIIKYKQTFGNVEPALHGTLSDTQLANSIFREIQALARVKTNDTIHIFMYLLDYPKEIDISKDNITSAECNSGSTTFYIAEEYVEVVLWRKEEWTKVLYHELIHAFYIDYTIRPNRELEDRLKVQFPHYNNSIREAYTEVLATLLENTRTSSNIKDQCVFLGTQVNKIAFYMECRREELVVFEKGSIADIVDIDDKSGIEYVSRFFKSPKTLLDPSTNTSSYYILKSIYLWCGIYKDNDLLITDRLLDKSFVNTKFYSVILEALESGEYIKWLQSIYFKPTSNSLMLTLPLPI